MSVFFIAEAGVNHNGDLATALAMIDVAAAAGADAVKFQTFRSEALATSRAAKAPYQTEDGGRGDQLEMLAALELSHEMHIMLRDRCRTVGIEFMSTPFDLESLALLKDLEGFSRLKLGSSEVTHGAMLVAAGQTGMPVILSTGMSTLDEVEVALGALAWGYAEAPTLSAPDFRAIVRSAEARDVLARRVTLLQCTTAYPTPAQDVNLRAMTTMAARFSVPVGFSDHTLGTTAAIAAVALGAEVIEKHFTLDRRMAGPDHKASVEPDGLKSLVKAVRETEVMLGDGVKAPGAAETINMVAARRSLITLRAVRKGERFDETNLGAKRPGGGLSPMEYWNWLGRSAARDYQADEEILP
jgi:N-acetylneuraminate synthase